MRVASIGQGDPSGVGLTFICHKGQAFLYGHPFQRQMTGSEAIGEASCLWKYVKRVCFCSSLSSGFQPTGRTKSGWTSSIFRTSDFCSGFSLIIVEDLLITDPAHLSLFPTL